MVCDVSTSRNIYRYFLSFSVAANNMSWYLNVWSKWNIWYFTLHMILHIQFAISNACLLAKPAMESARARVVKQHFSHFAIVWTALCVAVCAFASMPLSMISIYCRHCWGAQHSHTSACRWQTTQLFNVMRCILIRSMFRECSTSELFHRQLQINSKFIFIAKLMLFSRIRRYFKCQTEWLQFNSLDARENH